MRLNFTRKGINWSNKQQVLQEVRNDGTRLQFASDQIREDKDVVSEAVKNNPDALQYAMGEASKDRNITLLAIERDGMALRWADCWLQQDDEIVSKAVEKNPGAIIFAYRRSDGRKNFDSRDLEKIIKELEPHKEEILKTKELMLKLLEICDRTSFKTYK